MRTLWVSLCVSALFLVGCDDADDEPQAPVVDLSAATRPAPKPQKESLSIQARDDTPQTLSRGPRFAQYSRYAGQDIRQVTGVSGRTLWLCFTAPWCPHSRRMMQELRTMAQEEKGTVQIVEVDADEYPALAEEFGITKVPTTFLYTEGVQLRTVEGAYNAASLRRYLRRVLSREDDDTLDSISTPDSI